MAMPAGLKVLSTVFFILHFQVVFVVCYMNKANFHRSKGLER